MRKNIQSLRSSGLATSLVSRTLSSVDAITTFPEINLRKTYANVVRKRRYTSQIVFQSDQSVPFVHLSETRKLVGHIHHSITVSWQKFSSERNVDAPRELSDVVDHDRAHARGHNAAGHQQEFDIPRTGRA